MTVRVKLLNDVTRPVAPGSLSPINEIKIPTDNVR